MNLLHRVFHGRVGKPRPTSTDRHQGNTPKVSPWSPTQSHRMRDPSPRATSATTGPSLARVLSMQHGESSQRGIASISKTHIKEENNEDNLTMVPAKDLAPGSVANDGQPERSMVTDEKSNEDTSPEMSVKKEPSEGGSFEEGSDANEGQPGIGDAAEDMNTAGADHLSSDQPIPSIEQDDIDNEDKNQPRPRKKTPPFLHGTTHRPDNTPISHPGDGVDDGVQDEDFEEELSGEVEEEILIDNNDLRYWLHHKRSTAGVQSWPSEACRLYKLLFLRGLYPMFASQWTWNFLDHPMPGELFTPLGSDDKCFLKTEKSDNHASKALIRLFNLHGYVSDYRQCGIQKKIAPLIEKEIKRYVLWAERDGDLVKKHDYISPVFVITYKDAKAASTGQPIVERCQALVEEYRSLYAARGIQDYPRCIYIFVVVQHIVLVMVADTEHPDEAEPYPLAELDLSQRSHWLDYSLGIAITVVLAKESLLAHRWALPAIEVVEDDPDL